LTAGHLASAAAEGQRAKPPSPARWGRAGAAGARATERSRARAHPLVHPLPTALPPVVRSEWPRRRTVRKCMAGTCKLRPGTWERWGVAALCIACGFGLKVGLALHLWVWAYIGRRTWPRRSIWAGLCWAARLLQISAVEAGRQLGPGNGMPLRRPFSATSTLASLQIRLLVTSHHRTATHACKSQVT
jgi:hypothetical protein